MQLLQHACVQTLPQKLLLRAVAPQRAARAEHERRAQRTRDLAITSPTTLPYNACTSAFALLPLMLARCTAPAAKHAATRLGKRQRDGSLVVLGLWAPRSVLNSTELCEHYPRGGFDRIRA